MQPHQEQELVGAEDITEIHTHYIIEYDLANTGHREDAWYGPLFNLLQLITPDINSPSPTQGRTLLIDTLQMDALIRRYELGPY